MLYNKKLTSKKSLRKLNNLKKKQSFDKKIKQFLIIVKWIITIWFPYYNDTPIVNQINLIVKWYNTKGPEWTIQRIKTLRLILSRNLAKTPLDKQPYLKYHRNSTWPKFFFDIKHFDEDKIDHIRLAYTILEISKIIDWWPKPDYSSITNKPNSNLQCVKGSELANIYKRISDYDLNSIWESYHYSVKSGPIGRAVTSSLEEIKHLDDKLFNSISTFGGQSLKDSMTNCKKIMSNVPSEVLKGKYFKELANGETLRKISHIKSPEGKLRPIAIFDYWSQTSLKPFHETLFRALRTFSQDCTFNHNHAKSANMNYCYDLTSATDRFPMHLQMEFLSEVIGHERALAWKEILLSRKFRTPEGDFISYETGQPMGAYSSWAIFSLCHHLIVQHCAESVGETLPFKQYYLLGDDIVIQNSDVALKYEEVLQNLGIEISETKTIKSKDFMTFAKRNWYKGVEVTPFHVSAIIETYKSYINLFSYITVMPSRGWELPYSNRCNLIKQLLVKLGMPRSYATKQAKNIYSLELLIKMINTYPNNPHIAVEIGLMNNFQFRCTDGRSVAQEFLLEVTGSLKLQMIQECLIETVKEINGTVNSIYKFLLPHSEIGPNDLGDIPMISVLIKKSNELLTETKSTSELASSGFINLARIDFNMLPDPTRLISQSHNNVRASPQRSIINKIGNFLKMEKSDIEYEMHNDD